MNANSFPVNGFPILPLADVTRKVPFYQGGQWLIPYNTVTAASGNPVTVDSQINIQLPKLSTDVFANGDILYWDVTNGRLTVTATGNSPIGVATAAAANPSSTGWVLINTAPKRVGFGKMKLVPLLTIPAGIKPSNSLSVGTEWNGAKVFAQDIGNTPGTPDATAANLSGVVSTGNLVVRSAVNVTADTPVCAMLVL